MDSTNNDFGFANDGTFGVLPNQIGGFNSRKFRHPWAVTFHLFLKIITILTYLFGSWFQQDFLGLFVTLIFFISIDFWIVKNITGRLLVGLRWWNYIDENGQSHWIFENRYANNSNKQQQQQQQQQSNNNQEFVLFNNITTTTTVNNSTSTNNNSVNFGSDATVFWISLFLFTLFWFFSLFSTLISLNIQWLLFVAIALVLSGSNLYGYIRCRFGSVKNYNYGSVFSQYVGPRMIYNMMRTSAANQFASSTSGSTPSPQQQQQQNI